MTSLRLQPQSLVAGGAALARDDDGRVVFIDGALPGETVEVAITEARRDYATATVIEVVETSPDRVAPPCPHVARGCGGCGWQHISHEGQLRWKEQIVADALTRTAKLEELPPIRTTHADVGGRRTSVRVAVRDGKPAFHLRASEDVVTIDSCMVTDDRIGEILAHGDFGQATGAFLRVSAATGDAIAILDPSPIGARLPEAVRVGGIKAGLAIDEVVDGHTFRLTGQAFFQASPAVADALVDAVRAAAGDLNGKDVVDAYGGVGIFALAVAVAGGAASVDLIESDRIAAADARHNLTDQSVHVLQCEVGKWRPRPVDVVIADPARPGLAKPGVTVLVAANPSILVLVSCDAASMARDTRLLVDAGYLPTDVSLVDAFPHTPHVELVTRFERSTG